MYENKKNFLLIIPAYQEEKNISKVVKNLKGIGDILVIDDGSSDQTLKKAKIAGAKTIRNLKNKGYDFSIKKGLFFGANKKYKFLITVDADGQHKKKSIKKIKKKILNDYDIVCGKRNIYNRFSEHIFCLLFKIIWKVDDPLCGLKAYKKKIIDKINLNYNLDTVGTDVITSALDKKARIYEMDIQISRRKNTSTFGFGLMGELKILKGLILLIYSRLSKN
tara:strand:+ start:3460 stop:4122 length:663 start_codon:yes stop_codon:yes gene_type:complete